MSGFVRKIRFEQDQGAAMPPDNLLLYLEKYILAPAEKKCRYGVYPMACEIPVYFVSGQRMDHGRLGVIMGLLRDGRCIREIAGEDVFHELFGDECRALERALRNDGRDDTDAGAVPGAPTDFLGLYIPKGEIQTQGPEIWISYEKICRLYSNLNDQKYATVLTLAHELGHAVMNAENSGLHLLCSWVEEPLANKIALDYLNAPGPSKSYGTARMDFAKKFVNGQPVQYKFGLDLFQMKGRLEWEEWKACKWLLCLKTDALIEWRKYVLENIGCVNQRNLFNLYKEIARQPFTISKKAVLQAGKIV